MIKPGLTHRRLFGPAEPVRQRRLWPIASLFPQGFVRRTSSTPHKILGKCLALGSMRKSCKLAVAGDAGSFSEEAALLYAQREGLEADLVFAIDMEGVLSRVQKGEVDLGIFPVVNSRGGLVQTAFEAMGRHLFEMLGEVWLDVHQCLMALPGALKSQISAIASHPQAISQCERYLARKFPGVELKNWEDTAKAAKDLAAGVLSKSCAVIAPRRSAQIYGLEILQKGIQDNHPNLTTFIVVKKLL